MGCAAVCFETIKLGSWKEAEQQLGPFQASCCHSRLQLPAAAQRSSGLFLIALY